MFTARARVGAPAWPEPHGGSTATSRLRKGGDKSPHSKAVLGDGDLYFGDLAVSAFRLNAAYKEAEVWNGMVSGEVFGSPLQHDHTLFVTTGEGELFAFDTKGKGTLEPLINGRAIFPKGTAGNPLAYTSLTLGGNYLFLTSNHGETIVLEATRTARLISRNRLPAGSGASPVFSGKDLFLRAGDKLICIGEEATDLGSGVKP